MTSILTKSNWPPHRLTLLEEYQFHNHCCGITFNHHILCWRQNLIAIIFKNICSHWLCPLEWLLKLFISLIWTSTNLSSPLFSAIILFLIDKFQINLAVSICDCLHHYCVGFVHNKTLFMIVFIEHVITNVNTFSNHLNSKNYILSFKCYFPWLIDALSTTMWLQ